MHGDFTSDHLAEAERLRDVVRIGGRCDRIFAARFRADVEIDELPVFLGSPRLHAESLARPDVDIAKGQVAIGREDESVEPVVAVGDRVRSTDLQFARERAVLAGPVATQSLFCEISVVRLHERPDSKARRREPLAFRADVSERRSEVSWMAALAVHHRSGSVRRHLRQEIHGNTGRVFRMRRVQLEIGVRCAVLFVNVL